MSSVGKSSQYLRSTLSNRPRNLWLLVIITLGSCARVSYRDEPDNPDACQPTTCKQENKNCGVIFDGCGGELRCGDCEPGHSCGVDLPNVCGLGSCTPTSCTMGGKNCGVISDGCSVLLDCGECTAPETCGGAGVAQVCGCEAEPGKACEGKDCGLVLDACEAPVSCGQCNAPDSCGGGGVANVCGCRVDAPVCSGKACGAVASNCGLVDCGDCTAPETCGGGGDDNVCGVGTCIPDNDTPCMDRNCGDVSNNCGEIISCGQCNAPETCGGEGVANLCGCTDATACSGKDCGNVTNSCGKSVSCGTCVWPESCTSANLCEVPSTIVWSANHETSDISQWSPGGSFSGAAGSYVMTTAPTAPVRSGANAVALTIDTNQTAITYYSARLRRTEALPAPAYYYSAWFYIPAGVVPTGWVDLWHFHSVGGSIENPMFVVGFEPLSSQSIELVMRYRPGDPDAATYRQSIATLIPVMYETWFHVEALYVSDSGTAGQITVWQDGQQIFDVQGKPTLLQDESLYWSVGLFTSMAMIPAEPTIYVDDAAISDSRLGP